MGNLKIKLKDSPFFEYGTPFTAYEAFKLVLLLPLVPIRVLLGCLAIALIALINGLAAYNWPVDKPLTPKRRSIVLQSRKLLTIVFYCLGFRIRVNGWEHIEQAERLGALLVFNHVAWLDAFIVVWLCAPSGVAKAFNAKIPVIKHAVRALQTVYIPDSKPKKDTPSITAAEGMKSSADVADSSTSKADSGSMVSSGKKVVVDAYMAKEGVVDVMTKRVNDPNYCKLGGYPMLCLAPEGTTSNGRCVMEFRTGAFVLGKPVLPVCLHYRFKHHSPAWTFTNEAWQLLRTLTQFVNYLDVTIQPPYMPNAAEVSDPRLYANNVRARMARTLGLPMAPVGMEQYLALRKLGVGVAWDGIRTIAPPGVVVNGEIVVEMVEAKKDR